MQMLFSKSNNNVLTFIKVSINGAYGYHTYSFIYISKRLVCICRRKAYQVCLHTQLYKRPNDNFKTSKLIIFLIASVYLNKQSYVCI